MAYWFAVILFLVFLFPIFLGNLISKERLKSIGAWIMAILTVSGLTFSPVGAWLFPAYSAFEISDVLACISGTRCFILFVGLIAVIALTYTAKKLGSKLKFSAKMLLFLTTLLPPYFLWQSINTNAVASSIVNKAIDPRSGFTLSNKLSQRYLRHLAIWSRGDKQDITSLQTIQLRSLLNFSVESLAVSTESDIVPSKTRDAAKFVQTVIGQTSAFCTVANNPTTDGNVEQLLGSVSRKLLQVGERCLVPYSTNSCANGDDSAAILANTLDFTVEKFMERNQRYLSAGSVPGTQQAVLNYPTMRSLSSLTQGKKNELDLAIITQCAGSVQKGRALPQVKLLLNGIMDVVPESDFTKDNQQQLAQAVRRLVMLTPRFTPTIERKQVKQKALLILEQWKNWAKRNELRQVLKEVNFALNSDRFDVDDVIVTIRPVKPRLDVYCSEIVKVMQSIEFHRGSLERVKPKNQSEVNVVLQYHQLARRNEASQWRQIENVPDDPNVARLQSSLEHYFYAADKVFENQKLGRMRQAKQFQQKADMAMSHALVNLSELQKRIYK